MPLYKPHDYQKKAIQFLRDNASVALYAEVGRGKSSITLTILEELMANIEVRKPLIVAPKRVASSTWKNEISKWNHTKHLRLSRIIGNEKQRIKALMADADVYTVSRDNIAWMVDYCARILKRWP